MGEHEFVAGAPPMEARYTRLRPPSSEFTAELYRLASLGRIPWDWHSGLETPRAFSQSLWNGVLCQFAIEERRRRRQVGLLRAYGGNAVHGFAYVSFMLLPKYRLKGWPLEGALLFGNYLFTRFNLLNIYAETAASYFEKFRSGTDLLFEVEGRLRDRLYVNGAREDLLILRFSRQRWLDEGAELLRRTTTRY